MTTDAVGHPRVESSARRLRELNPTIEIEAVPENVTLQNAASLIARVDLVINAAPLFEERLAMNPEVVRQRRS
jgi:molybdopterin/thiamine biosynthesis adenylyltransferase